MTSQIVAAKERSQIALDSREAIKIFAKSYGLHPVISLIKERCSVAIMPNFKDGTVEYGTRVILLCPERDYGVLSKYQSELERAAMYHWGGNICFHLIPDICFGFQGCLDFALEFALFEQGEANNIRKCFGMAFQTYKASSFVNSHYGFVYLCNGVKTNRFKIGRTNDLERRMPELEERYGEEFKLVDSVYCGDCVSLEGFLHGFLSPYRNSGELYAFPSEIKRTGFSYHSPETWRQALISGSSSSDDLVRDC